jgi:hypothetical protein
MDKEDKNLLKILNTLKLEVHRKEGININNLAGLMVKAIQCVEKMKITGARRKTHVVDLILLLLSEHATDAVSNLTVRDLEEMVQVLFDAHVLAKKSKCTII